MDHSVWFQGSVLLRSFVLGILLAAAYDVFRLFRGTGRGIAAFFLDLLYGLIFCASVFVLVVCVLQTGFRFWQLAGIGLGMSLWFVFAGGWFRRVLTALMRLARLIFCVPLGLLQHAAGFLRRMLKIPAQIYGKKQKNLSKGTFHFPLNRLK